MTAYPNPNDQELKIQFNAKKNEQISIQMLNIQGKVVEKSLKVLLKQGK